MEANTLLSAGASPAMVHTLQELPEFSPRAHALCLNVGTLSGAAVGPAIKGVDSCHESIEAVESAKTLARASGAVGVVTDGERVVGAHNGVPMMTKITATGCSVTTLIAAFVAVDREHVLEATAAALSVFGVAGEVGMKLANGPASLLDEECVLSHVRISTFS